MRIDWEAIMFMVMFVAAVYGCVECEKAHLEHKRAVNCEQVIDKEN